MTSSFLVNVEHDMYWYSPKNKISIFRVNVKNLTLKILKLCLYVMDYHFVFWKKKSKKSGVTGLTIFQESQI